MDGEVKRCKSHRQIHALDILVDGLSPSMGMNHISSNFNSHLDLH